MEAWKTGIAIVILGLLFGCGDAAKQSEQTKTQLISGNITGLVDSKTVKLVNTANNETLVINTNGTFKFTTPLYPGTNYEITITQQPDKQLCTIKNGSGVIKTGTDVTDISVDCVDTYVLNVTVAGLSGANLVLQNNGQDDLEIPNDGIFTFSQFLTDSSNYVISISNSPPEQNCMLDNGGGTINGSDVTNVVIRCWSAPQPLYPQSGGNWNDYVTNDGATPFTATNTPCSSSQGDKYSSCLHGGEMRAVLVPGEKSCSDLTAADTLNAFSWSCDEANGIVRMVSSGLQNDVRLSDLIDVPQNATPAWKPDSVTVYKAGNDFGSTPTAIWWSNPIVANPPEGALSRAGTIYLVTQNTSADYTLGADGIAVVIMPGVTLSGTNASTNVLEANGVNYLWLEGQVNAAGLTHGIAWNNIAYSIVRTVHVSNTNTDPTLMASGILLNGASRNKLANIISEQNGWSGLEINGSSSNILSDISANRNGSVGIWLRNGSSYNDLDNLQFTSNNNSGISIVTSSNSNHVRNISAADNGTEGIYLYSSSLNVLEDGMATNNRAYGVYLQSSSNNIFSRLTVAATATYGIRVTDSTNNIFGQISVINSGGYGIYLENSSSNSLLSLAAFNNAYSGICLSGSSNTTLVDIAAAGNGQTAFASGFYLANSDNNYFSGLIKVGNNVGAQCSVTSGTNPGIDANCAPNGTSDFSAPVTITDLATSFLGKVTQTDTTNNSNQGGASVYQNITDWLSFATPYRGWGLEGGIFPDPGNQGNCTSTTTEVCRIWDWGLRSTDTELLSALTLPAPDILLQHNWTDATKSTFLRHAVEILGDGIGNDNTLCEPNEACISTRNIAGYQGHGILAPDPDFAPGSSGITMYKYQDSGY